jgi:hypothetical protein
MDAGFLASLEELYDRSDAAVRESVRLRVAILEMRQSRIPRDTPLIGPARCHVCGAPLAAPR